MTGRFSGRRAMVSGAARGIGAATARRFLSEGADVIAVDRLDIETNEVFAPWTDRVTAIQADVTAANSSDELISHLKAAGEPLDYLVNNAGIGGAKSIDDTSDEDWQRFIDINLTALFRVTRDLLPHMRQPGGRIVNISSVFGLVGFPGSLAYGVAKAGVAQMTRQLASDLSPRGILVNAIAPGVIETDMTRRRIHEDPWYQAIQVTATPAGRTGTPEDIAGAAAFLCSEDASFVAGHVLVVDGGWLSARYLPPVE